MGAGLIILSALGLGLTLALAAGKKDKKKTPDAIERELERAGIPAKEAAEIRRDAEEAVDRTPGIAQEPAPSAKAPATDWRAWLASKLMAAMQKGSATFARATADEIELKAKDPAITNPDLRSALLQGAAALRSAAASWEADAARREKEAAAASDRERAAAEAAAREAALKAEADRLRAAAEAAAREAAKEISIEIPGITDVVTPEPKEEPAVPVEEVVETAEWLAKKTFAVEVNNFLKAHSRWKEGTEGRTLVKQYQAQEQPEAGAIDGMYGVNTGLTFLKYDIIPAKPYYFPSSSTAIAAAKKKWTDALLAKAAEDPARAVEWKAASDVRYL